MLQSREWPLDGRSGRLVARTWWGADDPTHVVLLAHGYGEHIGRYEHVAAALVANGAVVQGVDLTGAISVRTAPETPEPGATERNQQQRHPP